MSTTTTSRRTCANSKASPHGSRSIRDERFSKAESLVAWRRGRSPRRSVDKPITLSLRPPMILGVRAVDEMGSALSGFMRRRRLGVDERFRIDRNRMTLSGRRMRREIDRRAAGTAGNGRRSRRNRDIASLGHYSVGRRSRASGPTLVMKTETPQHWHLGVAISNPENFRTIVTIDPAGTDRDRDSIVRVVRALRPLNSADVRRL